MRRRKLGVSRRCFGPKHLLVKCFDTAKQSSLSSETAIALRPTRARKSRLPESCVPRRDDQPRSVPCQRTSVIHPNLERSTQHPQTRPPANQVSCAAQATRLREFRRVYVRVTSFCILVEAFAAAVILIYTFRRVRGPRSVATGCNGVIWLNRRSAHRRCMGNAGHTQ